MQSTPLGELSIYCADIGSVTKGNFGWALSPNQVIGTDITEFAAQIADDLNVGNCVAVGFECPLFVPLPEDPNLLTAGRKGEGSRPWSAGAGSGALVTGLTEVVWVLREVMRRLDRRVPVTLNWEERAAPGLFIWEAFVSGGSKGSSHTADAEIGVKAFEAALPDIVASNAIQADEVHSLIGAALLRT